MDKTDKQKLATGAAAIHRAEREAATVKAELADTTPELVPEDARLVHLEKVIERGLATFMDVGAALLEIRDNKLYKTKYRTFELYCREKWSISRIHAHRLIESSAVAKNLLPVGNIQPSSERQVRPITGLPKKTQRKVWKEAVQSADGKQPTAKQVRAARPKRKRKPRFELPAYEPTKDEQEKLDLVEKLARKLAEVIDKRGLLKIVVQLDRQEKQRWFDAIKPLAHFCRLLTLSYKP